MTLSRRQFMALGVSGLVGACVSTKRREPAGGPSAVVVGAGLAGLAAARVLSLQGWSVVILEARTRLGGRVWTRRSGDGMTTEAGANWIHGTDGNPLTPLLEPLNLRSFGTDVDPRVFSPAGPLEEARVARARSLYERFVASLDRLQKRAGADLSVEQAFIRADIPAADRALVRHLLETNLADGNGQELSRVAVRHWGQEDEFEGGDHLLLGGLDGLIEKLSDGLDIRTSRRATLVAREGDGLRVEDATGASWPAHHVLVTVPLGVLKAGSIRFEPALPPAKTEAIRRCGFGFYEKVIIRHDGLSNGGLPAWVEFASEDPRRLSSLLNLEALDGANTLIGLVSGPAAEFWARADEARARELVSEQLRKMWGARAPRVRAIERTAWLDDPDARGSFSFRAVEERPEDRAALGASVNGTLHFAGEACQTDHMATMHAAWISGERAARRMLESS